MPAGQYRFEAYRLDIGDRRLMRGTEPVDVSGRYFDALELSLPGIDVMCW